MKGTSFQKPFEYRLEVAGESWRQGEMMKGELIVKNHGATEVPLTGVGVALVHGLNRKVREKAAKAIHKIGTFTVPEDAKVAANAEARFSWEFELARDCPITDNTSSPFLLYGAGEPAEKAGQLQAAVTPFILISQVLEIFSIQFRFPLKSLKAVKGGWVEAKLMPPTAKSYSALDHLSLSLKMSGDDLALDYAFEPKKLEPTPGIPQIKPERREHQQVFTRANYALASGRLNHDWLEAQIRDALGATESKGPA